MYADEAPLAYVYIVCEEDIVPAVVIVFVASANVNRRVGSNERLYAFLDLLCLIGLGKEFNCQSVCLIGKIKFEYDLGFIARFGSFITDHRT